ncbi:MAG TPA: alpha/beta hydrolase [Actinobacteria bacterium]|nr:alpha/beta hydrolase family protein [bacterium BMS3Bbin01]HDH25952.1 alpha/beta hydrolase [Actinomycetota bacterium]
MLRFVLGVVLAVLVVLGGLWLFQRRLIYFPTWAVPPVSERLPGWEEASFETADGLTLHGWFTPPSKHAPVVVVFNGNAGNRADRAPLGAGLAAEGFGVLLFDYRGYGDNLGHPTAAGLALDARAAVQWVRQRAPRNDLVYFGESLGAAVATELAVSLPPAALVLRSPFTSLADLAAVHYPLLPARILLRDEYPTLDRIGAVATATLVIGGAVDSIVPIDQSRAIFEAAPHPKELVIVPGADHNDLPLVAGPKVIEATARFITEAGSLR